jgi:Leucine-rich repeat (LRR) protein
MNHNKIQQLSVDGNYPVLMELSLIGNGLETLDFSVLTLPKLEIMNVSKKWRYVGNNHIRKLITKYDRSVTTGCPSLKALILSNFEIYFRVQ